MPIPILLMLAGGGALWLRGDIINKQAIAIEAEAERRQQAAVAERQRLIREWEAAKQDFNLKIRGCSNIVKIQHDYSQQRSGPVFDRFGYPVGDVSKFPLPPGMEQFTNIVVLPMVPDDAIIQEVAFRKQLDTGIKNAGMIAQRQSQGTSGPDPVKYMEWAALGAGMASLKAGNARKNWAEKALTAVIKAEAESTKEHAEIQGRKQTHRQIVERGQQQCAVIVAAVKFVIKYSDICDGYIAQGRTRATITEDEFANVKRLASAVRIVNEIARQAVA